PRKTNPPTRRSLNRAHHRGRRLAARRDDHPDPGLHRQRLPRGQQVARAGARRHCLRTENGRLLRHRGDPTNHAPAEILLSNHEAPMRPPSRRGLSFRPKESSLMNLTEQLSGYVAAAFSGLWVHTLEPDEAERDIVQHARQRKWKIAVWDVANGL